MSKSMFRVPFSIKLMVQLAMLIALQIVLTRVLAIEIGNTMRISFSFVPIVVAAIAYGPVWSTVVYVIADLVGAILKGYTPLPGLTVGFALTGLVLGIFLFHADSRGVGAGRVMVRIVAATVISQLLFSLLFNSFVLFQAYHTYATYPATILARVPSIALLAAAQLVLTPVLIQIVAILRKQGLLAKYEIARKAG